MYKTFIKSDEAWTKNKSNNADAKIALAEMTKDVDLNKVYFFIMTPAKERAVKEKKDKPAKVTKIKK